MKHLDTLLDELQHPVAQLMDWCKEDQDRAIVACLRDLIGMKDGEIFEIIREIDPAITDLGIAETIVDLAQELIDAEDENIDPCWTDHIDEIATYASLEHIINDRIEVYNKS